MPGKPVEMNGMTGWLRRLFPRAHATAAGLPSLLPLLLPLFCLPWFFSLPGVYLFDDYITPLNDPASQGLGAFLAQLGATIRPLTKLTYAVEASLGLDTVDCRRIVQIAMHAGNGVLFLLLLRRLVPEHRQDMPLLLAVAALYLLHPIQAEKVLAVAGRPTLLMEGLLLGAMLAAAGGRYAAAMLLFAASLLARETALVFLPLLAMLLPASRDRERWLLALVTVLVVGLLAAVPRYRALFDFSFAARDVASSCIQQVSALPLGFSLYFAPWNLSIDHGEHLAASAGDPLFLGGVLNYIFLLSLACYGGRRGRLAALWILAAIMPTQSCIPKLDALTERPFALALPGCLLCLLWLGRRIVTARMPRPVMAGALVATIAVLAVATATRSLLYRNESAIWKDAMVKSATNIRPHLNSAALLIGEGRTGEARAVLLRAWAIDPFDAELADALQHMQYQQLLKENDQ